MKELRDYQVGAQLQLSWDLADDEERRTAEEESVTMESEYPEARVLVVLTGGTMCMRPSPDGLVTSSGFLEAGMAPMPCFNDGSRPGRRVSTVNLSIVQPEELQRDEWALFMLEHLCRSNA